MSRRSSAIAVLAAVFFAGAAVTLGVLRVAESRRGPAWGPESRTFWRGEPPPLRGNRVPAFPEGPLAELARTRVTEHMTRTLGLTDAQRHRIDEALERRSQRTQEAMNRVLPTLRSHMDSLNAEIEAILTPEQRAAYRDYLREERERYGRRGGWPSRGRGGRTR